MSFICFICQQAVDLTVANEHVDACLAESAAKEAERASSSKTKRGEKMASKQKEFTARYSELVVGQSSSVAGEPSTGEDDTNLADEFAECAKCRKLVTLDMLDAHEQSCTVIGPSTKPNIATPLPTVNLSHGSPPQARTPQHEEPQCPCCLERFSTVLQCQTHLDECLAKTQAAIEREANASANTNDVDDDLPLEGEDGEVGNEEEEEAATARVEGLNQGAIERAVSRLQCVVCGQQEDPRRSMVVELNCSPTSSHPICLFPCMRNIVGESYRRREMGRCPSPGCGCFISSAKVALVWSPHGERSVAMDLYREWEMEEYLKRCARCPNPTCTGVIDVSDIDRPTSTVTAQSTAGSSSTPPLATLASSTTADRVWMTATCPQCQNRFCYLREGTSMRTIQLAVMDLYVTLAKLAINSHRWRWIFRPFPDTILPPPVCESALDYDDHSEPETDIRACIIREAINQIPSMVSLVSREGAAFDVRRALRERSPNPLLEPLFTWILTAHRSRLTLLPPSIQLDCMKTSFQYVMLTDDPDKEKMFQYMKRIHGSRWAFHGSAGQNWHSILHNGLKNVSNTKLMVNGARYGEGIYLSPNAAVSFGYSGLATLPPPQQRSSAPQAAATGQPTLRLDPDGRLELTEVAGKNAFLDSQMRCVAVVEVLNHQLNTFEGDIWVQPNASCVRTRFLFVYLDAHSSHAAAQTHLCKVEVSDAFNAALSAIHQLYGLPRETWCKVSPPTNAAGTFRTTNNTSRPQSQPQPQPQPQPILAPLPPPPPVATQYVTFQTIRNPSEAAGAPRPKPKPKPKPKQWKR